MVQPNNAYPTDPRLFWDAEKIIESIENTKTFIEARISHIAKCIDPLSVHILSNNQPICDHLNRFLDTRELDRALDLIGGVRESLQTASEISLTMLPDLHINSKEATSKQVKERQRAIAWYVKRKKPSIVFVEGSEGLLTWESVYKEFMHNASKLGIQPPTDYNEFKKWKRESRLSVWWYPFLDQTESRIVGMDRIFINQVVLILESLSDPALPKEAYNNTACWLNFNFREQYILANILNEMHIQGDTQAFLTLGEMHIHTFSTLCKEWGVNLEIARS